MLDNLPDAEIVAAVESRRGGGRDEYPVSAMWRALVAGMVFGHESSASLLRELGRNPALLSLCGFDPLGRQSAPKRALARRADGTTAVREEARPWRDGVPTSWAFSRFLSSVADLEDRTGAVSAMVDVLRGRLLAALPGYGRHLGYDGKAVPSRSTGRRNAKTGEASDRARTGGSTRRAAWTAGRAGLDEGEDVVRLWSAPGRQACLLKDVRGGRTPNAVIRLPWN